LKQDKGWRSVSRSPCPEAVETNYRKKFQSSIRLVLLSLKLTISHLNEVLIINSTYLNHHAVPIFLFKPKFLAYTGVKAINMMMMMMVVVGNQNSPLRNISGHWPALALPVANSFVSTYASVCDMN
jgi:hypothetical protein